MFDQQLVNAMNTKNNVKCVSGAHAFAWVLGKNLTEIKSFTYFLVQLPLDKKCNKYLPGNFKTNKQKQDDFEMSIIIWS